MKFFSFKNIYHVSLLRTQLVTCVRPVVECIGSANNNVAFNCQCRRRGKKLPLPVLTSTTLKPTRDEFEDEFNPHPSSPNPQPSTPIPPRPRTVHSSLLYIIPCVALGLLSLVIIAVVFVRKQRQNRRQQYPNVLLGDTVSSSSSSGGSNVSRGDTVSSSSSSGDSNVLWHATGDKIRSRPASIKLQNNHITVYVCIIGSRQQIQMTVFNQPTPATTTSSVVTKAVVHGDYFSTFFRTKVKLVEWFSVYPCTYFF